MCRKGPLRPSPCLASNPPGPRLLGRGSTYLAYASYNTPPFVCVLSQNCWAAAWHWFGYMPPRWVRCGALVCLGMYGKRLYTFTVLSSQHANGPCLLFSVFSFYSPLVYNVR